METIGNDLRQMQRTPLAVPHVEAVRVAGKVGTYRIDEATRRHYAAIYARPRAMHSAFAQFLAIGQKDEADNLKAMQTKLAMPVLAIGAEKAFGANVAVVMRNAATNVREVVVPNAGHWLMEEAPAATIAAVQDFLAAH
jgi:pimeloyl-ACP methyl ester carboxylesterase